MCVRVSCNLRLRLTWTRYPTGPVRGLSAIILVQQGGVVSSSPLHGLLLLLEHFILLGVSAVVGVVGDVMRNIVVRTGFINN